MKDINITIRKMQASDLYDVVQIHLIAFPNFFLTELGDKFLFELYKNFMNSATAICRIAVLEGRVSGFAVGTIDPELFFRKLLAIKGFLFFILTMKALIKSPIKVIAKLIYALNYRGGKPENYSNCALLSSICVHPDAKSLGIGSKLINSFCQEAFGLGANLVYLTTDKDSNEVVNSFYLKNGFRMDNVIDQTNSRKMNRYIKFPNEKDF